MTNSDLQKLFRGIATGAAGTAAAALVCLMLLTLYGKMK